MKDATSLTDAELGQLLKTLASEEKMRGEQRNKEPEDKNEEQVEFLNKCRNLAQSVMPGPIEVDIGKSLEMAYQLFESIVSALQAHIQETKEEQKKEHHGQDSKVRIILKNARSLTDTELGQLLRTLASEEKTRSEQRNKEIKDKNTEQVKFLDKCRNLAQSVMLGPIEVNTNKPLERAYQLFESMVSTLQAHI